MAKELYEGNEAMAEAAVRAGLEAYFGYPITPQTEILEYLSKRMPELGRTFVQAEIGSRCHQHGVRRSLHRRAGDEHLLQPGVSLMMEGLSYIAGTEIPVVLVNVMRGGPGLGNIAPSQADYNQAVHGGGHGDYYPIVLAPASVQEAIDLMVLSFDLAEKYRIDLHADRGRLHRPDDGTGRDARDAPRGPHAIGIGRSTALSAGNDASCLPSTSTRRMRKSPTCACSNAGRRSKRTRSATRNIISTMLSL